MLRTLQEILLNPIRYILTSHYCTYSTVLVFHHDPQIFSVFHGCLDLQASLLPSLPFSTIFAYVYNLLYPQIWYLALVPATLYFILCIVYQGDFKFLSVF